MGIEGNFRQISPLLLEIIIDDLYVLELYLAAKETLETEEIQNLSTYLKYKGFDKQLYSIITDDVWNIGRLDIDRDWHAMHYLLTENASSWETCDLSYIVTKNQNKNRLLING